MNPFKGPEVDQMNNVLNLIYFSQLSRTSDNIYIGYGHKYSSANYAPPAIPQLSAGHPIGSDVIEDDDQAEESGPQNQISEDDFESTDEDEVKGK